MLDRTTFRRAELRRLAAATQGFDDLVRDPGSLLERIRQLKHLHTEQFGCRLLRHAAALRDSIAADTTATLIEAALAALDQSKSQDHDLFCRAWLDLASARILAGRYADATHAIAKASGHAAQVRSDQPYYTTLIDHSRAALLYSTEQTDAAAELLTRVLRSYECAGDLRRAALAERLLTYIEFRRNNHEAALKRFLREAKGAHRRQDEADLARIYNCIALCYTFLGATSEAETAIDTARQYVRNLGAELIELRIDQTSALIAICRDGIETAWRQIEDVRARCLTLRVPAEGLISLVNATEALVRIDPRSPHILQLCREIQVEASSLCLRVSIATATERLTAAASDGTMALPSLLRDVRLLIDPSAQLLEDETAN